MSITGTTAQGQQPCWDMKECYLQYRLSCYFDACVLHVTCILVQFLGSWLNRKRLMPPCSSCLRLDKMLWDGAFPRIIRYAPVKKWNMSSCKDSTCNEGSDLQRELSARDLTLWGLEEKTGWPEYFKSNPRDSNNPSPKWKWKNNAFKTC